MISSIGNIKYYVFLVIYHLYAEKLCTGIDPSAVMVNGRTINHT